MTRDDILRIAANCGAFIEISEIAQLDFYERFGRAVAAAEREECAKVCEAESSDPEMTDAVFDDHANGWAAGCDYCAAKIRARSKP